MRVLVVGAGAVGGYFGGRLANASLAGLFTGSNRLIELHDIQKGMRSFIKEGKFCHLPASRRSPRRPHRRLRPDRQACAGRECGSLGTQLAKAGHHPVMFSCGACTGCAPAPLIGMIGLNVPFA